MSFEQISYLAQIVASVGVIVSLIFVGLQIKQNTAALERNEHNSTMEQWTVIRQAIAQNRDIAELMTAGLHGERALDAAKRQAGADAAGKHMGSLPHLGQNAARRLSKGDIRINGRTAPVQLAQDAARRGVVEQC